MTPEIQYDATTDEYQLGFVKDGVFVVLASLPASEVAAVIAAQTPA